MTVVARIAAPVAAAMPALNVTATPVVQIDPAGPDGPMATIATDFDRACDSGSAVAHPGNCPAPAYPAIPGSPALQDLRDVVVPARLNHQKIHHCA
jgi:hypothetical protein